MNQKANPIIIAVAIVFIAGFIYFMYKLTTPQLQAPPDPRNGPPAYARKGGNMSGVSSGAAPAAPQHPGEQPAGAPAAPK